MVNWRCGTSAAARPAATSTGAAVNDLDRGRRQQDVLRAIWRKIKQEGLLQNLPRLWDDVQEIVQTDLTLADMLGLLPLANQTDTSDLRYFLFRQRHEVINDYSDAGQAVLIPQHDAVHELMQNVVLPPPSARGAVQRPRVAVINASEIPGMAAVAADRLELEGFETIVLEEPASYRQYNHTPATASITTSLITPARPKATR